MWTWSTKRERLGVVRGFWISLIVQERFKIFLLFTPILFHPLPTTTFLLQTTPSICLFANSSASIFYFFTSNVINEDKTAF